MRRLTADQATILICIVVAVGFLLLTGGVYE